jgi:hypothetical protein
LQYFSAKNQSGFGTKALKKKAGKSFILPACIFINLIRLQS